MARSEKTTYELSGCSICGNKDVVEIADHDAMKREMERVWSFHARRLRHPVPPNYLTDRTVFSQAAPLGLVRCTVCTHIYRRPRESPETLRREYADAALNDSVYDSLFESQRLAYRAQVRRLRKFAGKINHGLEVGSYMGGFLAAAREARMSFTGIDVNPAAARHGSRQRLHISTSSLEEVGESSSYDAIVIWNTFEQLPDVRAAARASRRLLRKDGVLAVRVPNALFYLRWRRGLNGPFGWWAERALVHNNLLGFPYREGFTPRSLRRLFDDTGFEIREVHGDTLVPVADRWTRIPAIIDERLTKLVQRITEHGWRAPWVEVYARAG